MNLVPEGYIKRNTSTIPFGYEFDEVTGFLKPIEEELEALQIAENMIVNEEVSLQAACDWLAKNDISGVAMEGNPLSKLASIMPSVDPELVQSRLYGKR